MLTFTPITLEHHALLRKYYAGCDYRLCEYSAGTKLMWSLYLRPSFAEEAGCLIVRNRIDGEWAFDYPVPGPDGDVDAALTAIESYCTDTETPLVISVVPEEKAPELLLRWPRLRMNNERNWKDYLYRAEDMAAFAGRKYSGQRNHINKFRKEYPDAKFVPLTGADMPLIENFWADYEQEFQKTSFNAKRELAYAKALARLLPEGWLLGGGLLVQRADLADSGLQELHADAVLAGLDDHGAVRDTHDAAVHAADGGQPVALLQGVAHLLGLLFPLVLGADHQEVENGDHQDDHHDRGTHTGTGAGGAGGRCVCDVKHGTLLLFYIMALLYRTSSSLARGFTHVLPIFCCMRRGTPRSSPDPDCRGCAGSAGYKNTDYASPPDAWPASPPP